MTDKVETKPKNKSYVFVHTYCGKFWDSPIIVLAKDDEECIQKIIKKYAIFDDMFKYIIKGGGKGGIELTAIERKQINTSKHSRKIYVEKNQSDILNWLPCYNDNGDTEGWDFSVVEKLI